MSNRRGFLKSIGATGIFACLPAIDIRPGISIETLKMCCYQDNTRYQMQSPFVECGNASATDGRIGIRVFDSLRLADTDSPLRIPPLAKTLDRLWKPETSWRDMSGTFEPSDEGIGCPHCMERGYLGDLIECDACYGLGEVDTGERCEYGEPITKVCDSCHWGWKSSIACPHCKGKPYQAGNGGIVTVDEGVRINAKYFNLVSSLPGARWNRAKTPDDYTQKSNVLLVEFQGGQAVVMGMVKNGT